MPKNCSIVLTKSTFTEISCSTDYFDAKGNHSGDIYQSLQTSNFSKLLCQRRIQNLVKHPRCIVLQK